MRKLMALVVVAVLVYYFWPDHSRRHPPGILVAEAPIQTEVQAGKTWEKNGYTITPLAEFEIKARLLSKHRYWLDRESKLAPVDFLLGWASMSDQKVLDRLSLSQGGRWYEWEASELPIPQAQIESQCANMHMVPANSQIESRLKSARVGDVVELKGYLISVQAPDGWHWKSSLSRSDTRGGSCELVWVEEFRELP
jgi:hypothetical protein